MSIYAEASCHPSRSNQKDVDKDDVMVARFGATDICMGYYERIFGNDVVPKLGQCPRLGAQLCPGQAVLPKKPLNLDLHLRQLFSMDSNLRITETSSSYEGLNYVLTYRNSATMTLSRISCPAQRYAKSSFPSFLLQARHHIFLHASCLHQPP